MINCDLWGAKSELRSSKSIILYRSKEPSELFHLYYIEQWIITNHNEGEKGFIKLMKLGQYITENNNQR